MNYTRDVLNFGMTAEKMKAAGIPAEFFAVSLDVKVSRQKGGKVELFQRFTGWQSSLPIASLPLERHLTMFTSLAESSKMPPRGSRIGRSNLDWAFTMHLERRITASLLEFVAAMLSKLLHPKDSARHFIDISPKDKAFPFINNLEGVSNLELGSITSEFVRQLKDQHQIVFIRVISGALLNSLNGLGFSATVLKLEDTGLGAGQSMLDLLDAPAEATGLGPLHSAS
ncbi:Fc.00g114330.m01.CDS01 [Cosmosporella sp. VM-42]